MIEELNLPSYIFSDIKLKNLKRKNFIYGRNGTGKSSISKAINEEYKEEYDVRIFYGGESFIYESESLDAIALGSTNAAVQPQIDKIKKEIDDINAEFNETEINTLGNRWKNSYDQYKQANDTLEKLYKDGAKFLKDNYSDIVGLSYNKSNYKIDKEQACLLDDSSVELNKSILSKTNLNEIREIPSPVYDIKSFMQSLSSLLKESAVKSGVISFSNNKEREWISEGVRIHNLSESCTCLFCGSSIEPRRLEALQSLISNKAVEIQNRVVKLKEMIENKYVVYLSDLKTNNIEEDLLPTLKSEYNSARLKLLDLIAIHDKYFDDILNILDKKDAYSSMDMPLIEEPLELTSKIIEINKIIVKHNKEKASLYIKQKEAKNKLKFNYIAEYNQKYNYECLESDYSQKKNIYNELEGKKQEKYKVLKEKQEKLVELRAKIIDESTAMEFINNQLVILGHNSFSLKQVGEDRTYKLYDSNGNQRDIKSLSTGEKNIMAFLWFVQDLSNITKGADKDKVIVLDDPMSSNDDFAQYFIIMLIQDLLKQAENKKYQIFILTHNIHFYLNCRYRWWKGCTKAEYDKCTIHLRKYDTKTKPIYIYKEKDDLTNSYDALWAELKWLYDQDKPEYMANPLRCIIETFSNFNNLSDIYTNHKELEKLLNVNSHGIDDFNMDINGKTREDLMNLVRALFESHNAISHFNGYWQDMEA